MFVKKMSYKNLQQTMKIKLFRLWKKRTLQKMNLHLWLTARAKELIAGHYLKWRKKVLEKEKNKFRSKFMCQAKNQKVFAFLKKMVTTKKNIQTIQKRRHQIILAKFWEKWRKRMVVNDVEKLWKLRCLQGVFGAWKGWWERKRKMKGFCRDYYEKVLKRYNCIKGYLSLIFRFFLNKMLEMAHGLKVDRGIVIIIKNN